MSKRKRSKVKKVSKSPRITWTPKIWEKLAKEFAKIQVRHQQGGREPSFAEIMMEAQLLLPTTQQRQHVRGISQCVPEFSAMVKKERTALTTRTGIPVNGQEHTSVKEVLTKDAVKILTAPHSNIAYEIPQGTIFNKNLEAALEKAGFKFINTGNISGVREIVKSPVEHVEDLMLK